MDIVKAEKNDKVMQAIAEFTKAAGDKYGNTLCVFYGRKYAKVERGNVVYCFIDLSNGNLLKAATYNAPAKHTRSNIYAADHGLSGVNEYGANYIIR